MFFHTAEVYIQLMEMLQQRTQRGALGHLSESIYVFRETFTAVSVLAIGPRNVSVRVVDITGQQYAGMYLTPVCSHLFAVLLASVEVGYFVCAEDIVHVFSQLSLQRTHHGEFFTHEDLRQQLLCAGEDHGLLVKVLNEGTFGQELRHVIHVVTGFFGQTSTRARQNGRTNEYRNVRQILDQFRHQTQVLRTVFLCGNMNLQESDVDVAQVIVVPLVRVADEEFAFGVVVFQPIFQGSPYEATPNNSNFNNNFVCLYYLFLFSGVPEDF